jgi:hypothetical protein
MPEPINWKELFPAGLAGSRFVAVLLLGTVGLFMAGCRPQTGSAANEAVHVAVEFDPAPPATGKSTLRLSLADAAGHPLRVAHLAVEGDMNHAGMRPAFAELKETTPGHYTGTIEFTMGGDWFLLVSGELAGGGHFEKRIDVPGVKAR